MARAVPHTKPRVLPKQDHGVRAGNDLGRRSPSTTRHPGIANDARAAVPMAAVAAAVLVGFAFGALAAFTDAGLVATFLAFAVPGSITLVLTGS